MRWLLLSALLLAACSPPSVQSYTNGQRETEIVDLLNQREYDKAVWLIESQDGKRPGNPRRAFLLGEAYLGRAGFEPLAVAARVSGGQSFSSPEARDIFPACPEGALGKLGSAEPKCLLKRIYFNVPAADDKNLARARELFRLAYPSAQEAPEWINVLVGTVELASCVKRVGEIYLLSREIARQQRNPSPEELAWLSAQTDLALREQGQTLARARYAGAKIAKLLTGQRDPLLFELEAGQTRFALRLGLARTFEVLEKIGRSPESAHPFAALDQLLTQEENAMPGGASPAVTQP